MSGPFSDVILATGSDMTPERRALLLRLANADGQAWTTDPIKNFTEHTAEIMYGDLANEVEKIIAEARAEAWDEGYDTGDPWQRRGNPEQAKAANPYRAVTS